MYGWLVIGQSVGAGLARMSALTSVTGTALLQLRYAACGAIQVLHYSPIAYVLGGQVSNLEFESGHLKRYVNFTHKLCVKLTYSFHIKNRKKSDESMLKLSFLAAVKN